MNSGYFHVLTIKNNAAMNIYVQTSVWMVYFHFSQEILAMDCWVIVNPDLTTSFTLFASLSFFCVTFKETAKLSYKVTAPFYIPMLVIYNETH